MKGKSALLLVLISSVLIITSFKNTEEFQYNVIHVKTVRIGLQTWTAENVDIKMPKSWYYLRDSVSNKKYGRLYYWSNAMAAIPKGWHVPSLEEWNELIKFCGGDSAAGGKLQEGGSTGLNLQLGGHLSANITTDLLFDMLDFKGFYWTSTSKTDQTAYAVIVNKDSWLVEKNYYRKANGFSVRLIKDERRGFEN